MESWKPIKGFEGFYEVSDQGQVRSLDRNLLQGDRYGSIREVCYRGRILKQSKTYRGYLYVSLRKNGSHIKRTVHSLVAEAFCVRGVDCTEVNHKDLDKSNNHYKNLEWCTSSQNSRHYLNMRDSK